MENELIAAVATGWGRSAIGIVRLSGAGAAAAAGRVFSPMDGRPLADHPARKLIYGTLYDREGRAIDRALCTWSPAPGSYTGEETAELQCHGSPTVLTLALEALFAQGAKQAGPGEFTRRAFLNGRLDLAQAEGVMDLIDAETPAAARMAAGQLAGALSQRVGRVYDGLVDVMAHFHAVLDYPDEDLDPFTTETITDALTAARGELQALLATYDRGRVITRGVPCAIVGRPNAGKSSLLNALVGFERAIVTDIPGTTRDTVEERVSLGGVLLRLIDTAGLRETDDAVEKLGVERSRAAMEGAELILAVTDGSSDFTAEDAEVMRLAAASGRPWIWVMSKQDLTGPCTLWSAAPEGGSPAACVSLSARTGYGMDRLEQAVAALFPAPEGVEAGALLTNARQAEAAGRARAAIRRGGDALQAGMPPDAVVADVEQAMSALGELTGRTVSEDVTARIFQQFCVGK